MAANLQDLKQLHPAGRILVMDDSKAVRDCAVRMLTRLGYEVACAEEGEQAVRLYQEAEETGSGYDLVILDLRVPDGMGGRETIERLRKLDPRVRAIVASSDFGDPAMQHFKQFGFSAAIEKPYNYDKLRRALNAVSKRQPTG